MALPRKWGYTVLDMDCHVTEWSNLFTEYLEPQYRQAAIPELAAHEGLVLYSLAAGIDVVPDILRSGSYHVGYDVRKFNWMDLRGKKYGPDGGYMFPGGFDGKERLKAMDADGIDKGLVRSTFMCIGGIQNHKIAAALARAYNNWSRDFCDADPKRLFPEAILPYQSIEETLMETMRVAKLGFKGAVVRSSTAGVPLSHPRWYPILACFQELGWPLAIHSFPSLEVPGAARWIKDSFGDFGNSPLAAAASIHFSFMLDNIMTMIDLTLTGVLDRFPNLKVYFIESGHSWVSEVLYRLDKAFYLTRGWFPDAKTLPSEIFKRQIYVPFEGGGQQLLSAEGITKLADNLIWASDIPHADSDPPAEAVVAFKKLGVPEDVQAKIMGGNASKLTGISLNGA